MTEIIQTSLTITAFVMLMMLVIEYVNVQTKGRWDKPLREKKWLQIVVAAFLGAIPGCLGVYTVVSLFTHKVVSFGALVSAMIATSGDEAFVMFAMIPKQALWISLGTLALAIIAGFITNMFYKNVTFIKQHDHDFDIHQSEVKCAHINDNKIIDNIRNMSFTRGFILTGLILFMTYLLIGGSDFHNHSFSINKVIFSEAAPMEDGRLVQAIEKDAIQACNHEGEHTHDHDQDHSQENTDDAHLGHDHSGHEHANGSTDLDTHDSHADGDHAKTLADVHSHDSHAGHDHGHDHGEEPPFNLPKTIFVILTIITIFITVAVPNHFIEEHAWNHVIKKHFLKIFLWTFGTLIFIYYANSLSEQYFQFDIIAFAKDNLWLLLIFAVIVGVLPESGPHMIFITLFAAGIMPLSILMANSIVQDGHGALPLFAENKKAFVHMKLINMGVGFLVGGLGIFFGF